jgi:hypothetical protein
MTQPRIKSSTVPFWTGQFNIKHHNRCWPARRCEAQIRVHFCTIFYWHISCTKISHSNSCWDFYVKCWDIGSLFSWISHWLWWLPSDLEIFSKSTNSPNQITRSGDFLQINQILQIKLPDLKIFSKSIKFFKSNSQIFSITSKTRCTSAKVSSLGLWSHWPQWTSTPPVHHPWDAHYYSVVDECQLS